MNFKVETFAGTLFELLESCNGHSRDDWTRLRAHHDWIVGELERTPNLLPIRKGHTFRERGRVVEVGPRSFLIADNEPLASQFELLLDRRNGLQGRFGDLLRSGTISASWKADLPSPGLRFRGIKSSFRDRGLKLAHVFDAANGLERIEALGRQMELRFFRSQSPLNVFLFPSPRVCEVTVKRGLTPTKSDLGEDPIIRRIALGYLAANLGVAVDRWDLFRCGLRELDLDPLSDWEKMAREIEFETRPKKKSSGISPIARHVVRQKGASPSASRQSSHASGVQTRWTTAAGALEPDEAIQRLRGWLADNPRAVQLDGRSIKQSNPSQWLHLRVEGFAGSKLFTSRYGPAFDGDDYNGIVNFHGDTPVDALRRFIDLFDAAESLVDMLAPSATYETRALPRQGGRIKPKFALKGFADGLEGFFMYHDQHPGKAASG